MKKEKDSFIRVSAETRSLVESIRDHLISARGEVRDKIKAEHGNEIEIETKCSLSDGIKFACREYVKSWRG